MDRIKVAVLIVLLAASTADAIVLNVSPDGNGEYPDIAAALAAAAEGDTVLLACGTYYEHELDLPNGLTLRSESGLADCATIDAQGQGRVLEGRGTTLMGITIRGGWLGGDYEDAAGALLRDDARVFSCDFIANTVTGGIEHTNGPGGLRATGNVLLVNCRFQENQAGWPDGCLIYGSATILGCYFSGDDAWISGASWEQATLQNCRFRSGAEIEIDFLHTVVNDCQFGPLGILTVYGQPDLYLTNVTFADGHFVNYGENLALFMDNCIVDTEDPWPMWSQPPAYVYLNCNDFRGNAIAPIIRDQIGLNGNIDADPQFCDAAGEDFTLADSSPCLPENNDCVVQMGAFGLGCIVTAAPETENPSGFTLLQNSPNPFNPSTEIRFRLSSSAEISLLIYDAVGRLVATLHDRSQMPAGSHAAVWNGRDDAGTPLPSGVYLYRLRTENESASGKMLLLE